MSKIILGCGSYGSKGWNNWVIDDQDEVNKHIKYAYAFRHWPSAVHSGT